MNTELPKAILTEAQAEEIIHIVCLIAVAATEDERFHETWRIQQVLQGHVAKEFCKRFNEATT